MKTVCIFAGSKDVQPSHAQAAREVSILLARRGYNLVWGGQDSGLMKVVGDAFTDARTTNKLIGVTTVNIRQFCADMHPACDQQIICEDEGQRNETYRKLSDFYVVLPGGVGSLTELAMAFDHNYLDMHRLKGQPHSPLKPIFMLNTDNFWRGFLAQVHLCTGAGDPTQAYSSPYTAHSLWPRTPEAVTPRALMNAVQTWEREANERWQNVRDGLHAEKVLASVA